ncbi:hypothetical protein GL4_2453 [Methyloceanibacter caenitepidi]|uniref:Uncharacterized protein n=1 Tax=Methyloceanibacter caenitepidi TaxID=1384459 RepID=A0A0A8K4P9_9HYPH|nr:hypothetical protein GL4_2453 [Methyloceanibacter caenitepidi]
MRQLDDGQEDWRSAKDPDKRQGTATQVLDTGHDRGGQRANARRGNPPRQTTVKAVERLESC